MRVAQYVRMSTEHQQYSIENQMAAIEDYAKLHDLQIVRTYSDEARSGIDLAHRPGLRSLLDDVVTCRADFSGVLVYDVSRWGRFQDTDESAHYEFLCKSAGVEVVYCSEQFTNDNSIATALLKTLKRTMAGEYLRELSAKVFAGQSLLARKGYKLGGTPGYGLRRLLLDYEGNPKMVLRRGERKCIAEERVTYVVGPSAEVRIVRKIYSLFLDSGMAPNAIANYLNERKIRREIPQPWKGNVVQKILSHPKYTGAIVFNQKSSRLRSRTRSNPPEQWIVRPDSFPGIISKTRFELAQQKLRSRVFLRSDQQLLVELRSFVEEHGRATQKMLAADPMMATVATYEARFGSFGRALQMTREEPPQGFSAAEQRARTKIWLQDEFAGFMAVANILTRRSYGTYTSLQHRPVLLDVPRCFVIHGGQMRWQVRHPLRGSSDLACIAIRLLADGRSIMDYVFIPRLPRTVQSVRLSDDDIRRIGFIRETFPEIMKVFLEAEHSPPSSYPGSLK